LEDLKELTLSNNSDIKIEQLLAEIPSLDEYTKNILEKNQSQGALDIFDQAEVVVEPQESEQAAELDLEDRFKALVKPTEQSSQEQQEELEPFVRKSKPKKSQKPELATISEEKAMDFSKLTTVSGPLANVNLSTEGASLKPKMPEHQVKKSNSSRLGG